MQNVTDFYPLTPMQQGMLFHSLLAPDSGVYVEQMHCLLRGGLEVPAFEHAWQRVVERHSILRTGFIGEELKEPVQVVHQAVPIGMERQDWTAMDPGERETRLQAWLQDDRARGFDLARPPLMRLALLQVEPDGWRFVWTHHHLLLDGWSVPLLLRELFACYTAFHEGRDPGLEPPRPFRDYLLWLRRQDAQAEEAYWRQTLKGFTAPTPLVEEVRGPGDEPAGEGAAEEAITLDRRQTSFLEALARQHHLTLSTIVQGAWAILLGRWSGEEDVLFGATVSGRPPDLPGAERMIGLFINTLPVRAALPAGEPAVEWLQRLQGHLAEMRQYEYSSLVRIQGWSEVPRGEPLFESLVVFENYPVKTALEGLQVDLGIEDLRTGSQTHYPLNLVAAATDRLTLRIHYDARRFAAGTCRRMLGHLQVILEGLMDRPQRPLGELPLLTEGERRQVLVDWNRTPNNPPPPCVQQSVEARAASRPGAAALAWEGETLSYGELNRRANRLAHRLQERGVGPETLVGVCLEPSFDLIIAILAVLKAGGAWLPLDPLLPAGRLAYMVADSATRLLLGGTEPGFPLPEGTQWLDLALEGERAAGASEVDPPPTAGPANLAYVIYTSGSTGRPKGTLLEHRGLANLIAGITPLHKQDSESRILLFASIGFDASVADIFSALVNGGCLVLASRRALASPEELLGLLASEAVTEVTLPPSLLALLPAEGLPALRTVVSAGEACPVEVAARWAPGHCFLNGYGPTEATVAACYYRVRDIAACNGRVPIGRPNDGVRIYILDPRRRPLPVGAPGELYIGGAGVGRGYLNRPELTAERFLPDPFADEPGAVPAAELIGAAPAGGTVRGAAFALPARMYRTGDRARFLPDGNIDFLGRLDRQVKIRGFRVEPDEVEAALVRHPDIRQAAVAARPDPRSAAPGALQLVAWLVPAPGKALSLADVRTFLQPGLPEYLLPSALVPMEALPLTPSGKVDRRALPSPDRDGLARTTLPVEPRDELESRLREVWEEVLDVRPIGIHDSFFDLGGHSLSAIRLAARIQERLGLRFSLATLFRYPTIAQLGDALRMEAGAKRQALLVPIQPAGAQPPLFFIHPSGGSVHWYTELAAALGPDQPFYGLQAQGLTGDQPLHETIEEMADAYIEALRTVQPEGPYRLGSWSMGVVVAYEMACRLTARGAQVELLALLDQGPVLPTSRPADQAEFLIQVFGEHIPLELGALRQMSEEEQVACTLQKGKQVGFIFKEIGLEEFRRYVRLMRAGTEAWRGYRPRPYPGPLTLFRAAGQEHPVELGPDLGWAPLAGGGLRIVEVPGDHLTMIHRPHVRGLARKLTACLAPAGR